MGLPRAGSLVDVRRMMREVYVERFDEQLAGPETAYDTAARDVWGQTES